MSVIFLHTIRKYRENNIKKQVFKYKKLLNVVILCNLLFIVISRLSMDTKKATNRLPLVAFNELLCSAVNYFTESAHAESAQAESAHTESAQAAESTVSTTVESVVSSAGFSALLPQDANDIATTATNINANFFIFFAF